MTTVTHGSVQLMWQVITRMRFNTWFEEQSEQVQDEILSFLSILEEDGPQLGRPLVDRVKESNYNNMKELRVQVAGHPFRIFFAFDPTRKAIVLCAGDKKGKDEKLFYKRMVKIADLEFKSHLKMPEVNEDDNT